MERQSEDPLKIFDSLTDVRLIADQESKNSGQDFEGVLARVKSEWMRKGTAFVCSTLLPHEPVACGICGAPSDSVEYNFFSNTGSLAQLSTLDGSRLHRIREHNELFPDDIKSFLLQLNSNGSSTSYTSRAGRVDRANVCPFLARIFIKHNSHFKDEDFSTRGKEPSNEVQLHLWKDSSLREITELLKEVEVSLRQQGLKLNYYFVYPDKRGKNVMKAVGTLDTFRDNKDDLKTLEELHFQIGDFIALEVYEKKSNF